MKQLEGTGSECGLFTWLGRVLKRCILGKSSHEYMSPFSGSDAYWEQVIAAQCACHEKHTTQADSVIPAAAIEEKSVSGGTNSQRAA